MKDEIKKILEMNKAGKITEEQASELIAELKSAKSLPSPKAPTGATNDAEIAKNASAVAAVNAAARTATPRDTTIITAECAAPVASSPR